MNDITGGRTPPLRNRPSTMVTNSFNLAKFAVNDRLTTQMKPVSGEVAIDARSRNLAKALRGLEVGATGFDPKESTTRKR